MFIEAIRTRVRGQGKRVVFPEGGEERALQAAVRLRDQGLVQPVVIGSEKALREQARTLGLDLAGIEVGIPRAIPAARSTRRRTTSFASTRA